MRVVRQTIAVEVFYLHSNKILVVVAPLWVVSRTTDDTKWRRFRSIVGRGVELVGGRSF